MYFFFETLYSFFRHAGGRAEKFVRRAQEAREQMFGADKAMTVLARNGERASEEFLCRSGKGEKRCVRPRRGSMARKTACAWLPFFTLSLRYNRSSDRSFFIHERRKTMDGGNRVRSFTHCVRVCAQEDIAEMGGALFDDRCGRHVLFMVEYECLYDTK